MKSSKKIHVIVLVIVCFCLLNYGLFRVALNALLPDNVTSRDWRYFIDQGYSIDEIYYGCYLLTNDSQRVVDSSVVSFCFNDSYIGVQCVRGEEIDPNEEQKDLDYYLIDMNVNRRYGPFTEEAYYQFCESNDIGEVGDWISTIPRPEGAVYEWDVEDN